MDPKIKPLSQDVPTHHDHVRAEVEKLHPGHANVHSDNDAREGKQLAVEPAPNVEINPATGTLG